MPSERSRWATEASQPSSDRLHGPFILLDRCVKEMVAINAPQVEREIAKDPFALLAGGARADDEVGFRQLVVTFEDPKE